MMVANTGLVLLLTVALCADAVLSHVVVKKPVGAPPNGGGATAAGSTQPAAEVPSVPAAPAAEGASVAATGEGAAPAGEIAHGAGPAPAAEGAAPVGEGGPAASPAGEGGTVPSPPAGEGGAVVTGEGAPASTAGGEAAAGGGEAAELPEAPAACPEPAYVDEQGRIVFEGLPGECILTVHWNRIPLRRRGKGRRASKGLKAKKAGPRRFYDMVGGQEGVPCPNWKVTRRWRRLIIETFPGHCIISVTKPYVRRGQPTSEGGPQATVMYSKIGRPTQ